jgi:hypothetical protein
MAQFRSGRCSHGGLLALLLLCGAAPAPLPADDNYDEHSFGFRLPPAFLRFTEVSTAGGGTVANRWSSSVNPASAGWEKLPTSFTMVAAPYYSQVMFENGTRLHVIGESLTVQTADYGTFQPILSQIRSNREENKQGLTFDYDVDSCIVQWGKRWGNVALGANFDYASAEIVQKFGNLRVSDSRADSYRWRFGGLCQPAEKWLIGAIFEFGYAPNWTKMNVPTPRGILRLHEEGQAYQYVFRPGVSYEYAPRSTVFVDYQWGQFLIGDGRMADHCFNAGIEHALFQWLSLRAGAAIDLRGNPAWTCGLSAHLSRNCSLDVGYHYDTLPELHHEFGRSQILQAVLSVRF